MSLLVYTYQCALKYTDIKLQNIQGEDLILTSGNSIKGGLSSVMGDRYVVSDDNKKILYMDSNKLYGHSVSQVLPYD